MFAAIRRVSYRKRAPSTVRAQGLVVLPQRVSISERTWGDGAYRPVKNLDVMVRPYSADAQLALGLLPVLFSDLTVPAAWRY
jgi:hypothetical protein